ncbi:MAG TPA: glycosyl hydrolase [Candidatus Limnocylindria bacterium]|nr:glycosyl hydrolase [Candidatus Limnocylindria bacterium]
MRSRQLRLAALVAPFLLAAALPAFAQDSRPAPAASPAPSPSASPSPPPPLQWRSIGPAVSGGRVATVAGTDLDPALFYAGAAGGGVWKSTNGGMDWQPVFDAEGSQSIGAIAISPKDARDVWVGTGEGWVRNDVLPGDGIYHSTDGAKTWTRMGLTGTSQIARVLIDPRDTRRILVAALGDPFRESAERGVFRSLDGGKTWEKTLYRGPAVGASDLAMDPRNPDVLYAGLWRFRRSAWRMESGGADDGIYKSTDGGATWTKLEGNGLPSGTLGRIALAIAPSDPKRVYALIESKEGLLWRSDDGGATWKMTSKNTLIDERPFYYTRVVVDPHDADHLFSVSVLLAESKNGGKTWHVSGKTLHGDHHDLWIAANGKTILEGNDGGAAISRDGGASWSWRNVLPISQFYHVAYDTRAPYDVCGGLQDNGAWCAPVRTGHGILPQDWTRVSGGDGTYVVPDPRDPNVVLAAAGGGDNAGDLARWDARFQTQTDVSPYLRDQNVVAPHRLRYRFNWETPIVFSPRDPRVAYTAGNVVFRTTDLGQHWSVISPDLTRNLAERERLSGGPVTLDVTGAETFDTILALAPSPLASGTLWAATDDGVIQLTRDGGSHWKNVTIPGLDADARVSSIEASHAGAGTAYAAVDRHFTGDRTPYVYVTTDYGAHWRAITDGLPHAEVHAVREDPADPRLLYAGTGIGVWYSRDRGASWRTFPAPLPPVAVYDLTIPPAGDLVIATHGRGMQVFDDLAPLRGHDPATRAVAELFPLRDAQPLERANTTANARPASADAPPATITFWQREPAKHLPTIEIVDAQGNVVRRFAGTHDVAGEPVPAVSNKPGFNRIVWALDADAPTPWLRAAPWDRGPQQGVPVLSGTYTVRLIRDGFVTARPIRVLRDRRIASGADERAGHALATRTYAELAQLDEALNVLDNLRLQLPDRADATADPVLGARIRETLAQARRVEATISSQPVNDQDDDFLEDLLRERVLTFASDLGPGMPPQAQLTEAAALQRDGDAALLGYRRFLAETVRPLELALRSAHLEALDLHALPPRAKPDPNADEHARRSEADH